MFLYMILAQTDKVFWPKKEVSGLLDLINILHKSVDKIIPNFYKLSSITYTSEIYIWCIENIWKRVVGYQWDIRYILENEKMNNGGCNSWSWCLSDKCDAVDVSESNELTNSVWTRCEWGWTSTRYWVGFCWASELTQIGENQCVDSLVGLSVTQKVYM